MNDDRMQAARDRANLQQKEYELSQQERQLRDSIEHSNIENRKLENRKSELQNSIKKHPNKPTPEQQAQFFKDSQEYKQVSDRIETVKRDLVQKNQQLKDLQTKQQASLQAQNLRQAGLENQHDRHAISPNPTGTRKGDVKRVYHQATSNSRQPQAPNHSNAKEIQDWNKDNQPKPNSPLMQKAKEQAVENQHKPQSNEQSREAMQQGENER
mgnify:CR=1 FL=1